MSQVVSFADYIPAPRYDGNPWMEARVNEGTASSGSWTLIDTLALDPVDTDPTEPQSRNLTTENGGDAAGLWYTITFADADGNTSQPSTPVQNVPASTTQFATSDEFAARLGLELTADEKTRADRLLATASSLIQDEAKQDIELVADDVLEMRGTTDERIRLPERPVVSVASVKLAGVPLVEGGTWFLDGNEIVRIGLTTLLLGGVIPGGYARGFGFEWQTLEIVYTHGYETIPQSLKAIAMEAVIRVWVNPGSVARESVGDTAIVYDNNRFSPSGLLLSDVEKRVIRRMFGRRARSITIGS